MSEVRGTVPRRGRPQRAADVPALSIEGLHKSFGELEVLRGIDLDVAEHEVVALIGASGSGKSTLLRCVNLIEPIDAGRIRIEGDEITAKGVKVDRIRRRIGIVYQAYNLFPHMRVHRQRDARAAQGPPDATGRGRACGDRAPDAVRPRREGRATTRTRCRAASSSGWRSCGRSRCRPTSCCSTRSRPPSTPSWSPRCST